MDKVRFDYRMRPGVVTKINALELMRVVGNRKCESNHEATDGVQRRVGKRRSPNRS